MDTLSLATAAVTGARHRRIERNGQDAVASWLGDGTAAVVVCDGCSAGASSEVGARLGAALWIAALATRLSAGASAMAEATWSAVRGDVGARLAALVAAMPGDALRDHFLFTTVSAVACRDGVAVWALGDGAYAIDGRTRVLGPFADNQPPYLAYDLLGAAAPAHFATADARAVVVATDGALDLPVALDDLVCGCFANPDALRRRLTVLARGHERIDWDERAVVRTPASLQDDLAVAAIRRQR